MWVTYIYIYNWRGDDISFHQRANYTIYLAKLFKIISLAGIKWMSGFYLGAYRKQTKADYTPLNFTYFDLNWDLKFKFKGSEFPAVQKSP